MRDLIADFHQLKSPFKKKRAASSRLIYIYKRSAISDSVRSLSSANNPSFEKWFSRLIWLLKNETAFVSPRRLSWKRTLCPPPMSRLHTSFRDTMKTPTAFIIVALRSICSFFAKQRNAALNKLHKIFQTFVHFHSSNAFKHFTRHPALRKHARKCLEN